MQLGNLKIATPIWLAPMAGISDIAFRTLMREMGAGVSVTELISCEATIRKNPRTLRMIRLSQTERPAGVQIFGCNPQAMADTAKFVEDSGADYLDINLGCPVRKIVSQGAGAFLLQDFENLKKVLTAVKAAISIPLTIKIRTGFNDDRLTFKEVIQIAYDSGVCAVAIHGRTREQGYEGFADWQVIAQAKRHSPLPIIGNGDLIHWKKALERWRETDCDGIMIGRGALRNPWIFQELRLALNGGDPTTVLRNPETLLKRHAELLREYEPAHLQLLQLKKFVSWYCTGMPNSSRFRASLFALSTIGSVYDQAMTFFTGHEAWSPIYEEGERFLMGGHG